MPIKFQVLIEEQPDGNVTIFHTSPATTATQSEIGYATELRELINAWEAKLKERKKMHEKRN